MPGAPVIDTSLKHNVLTYNFFSIPSKVTKLSVKIKILVLTLFANVIKNLFLLFNLCLRATLSRIIYGMGSTGKQNAPLLGQEHDQARLSVAENRDKERRSCLIRKNAVMGL